MPSDPSPERLDRCPIHGSEWCTCPPPEQDPSPAHLKQVADSILRSAGLATEFKHDAGCAVHSPTLRPCSCGLETKMRSALTAAQSRVEAQSELIEGLERMLVAYRTGTSTPEATLDKTAKARERLAALAAKGRGV